MVKFFISILVGTLLYGSVAHAQADTSKVSYTPYELLSSYYKDDFKPFKKGNSYVGLSFSVQDKNLINTERILGKVLNGDNQNYNLLFKGGYYLWNYAMVGLNFNYSQSKFTGRVFVDPDTTQVNSISRGYSFTPNFRSSIPLTASERFSFFIDLGVSLGWSSTVDEQIKNLDEISKSFSTQFNFGIGISPGITFFAMENFAFELQLNVLGYTYQLTKTKTDGQDDARDERNNVNFSIDILSLDIGLAYYIGSGKQK